MARTDKRFYFTDSLFVIRVGLMVFLSVFLINGTARATEKSDTTLLDKIFRYRSSYDVPAADSVGSAYIRYVIITDKRNPTLMCIPTMFAISRGKRSFVAETYSKTKIENGFITNSKRLVEVGTIPSNRKAMPTMVTLVTPTIYDVTIYDEHTISPLNKKNEAFYKYSVTDGPDSTSSRLLFKPKIDNIQLVSGWAVVDDATGMVREMNIKGQYDMTKYNVDIKMSRKNSLLPEVCTSNIKFSFLGNRIIARYKSVYHIGVTEDFGNRISNDRKDMERVRPIELTDFEKDLYAEHDSLAALNRKKKKIKKKETWQSTLLDNIADKMLSRQTVNFGNNDKGVFKISPILNPLYLGYSDRKGLTYKFKLQLYYAFSPKCDLSLRLKGGYAFKQHQTYVNVPVYLNYNHKHNGYIKLEVGNGNRIINSEILNSVANSDSIKHMAKNMIHFRDFNVTLLNHYDISEKFGFEAGVVLHRRSAVHRKGFDLSGKPDTYYSFAPMLELQYRPGGFSGPIITLNYERNINGVWKTNTSYERYEADVSYKYNFHKLRSVSLRAGTGFYTARSKDAYFLDYANFRENNIIGGWNDDWTCEFQLLSAAHYNSSKYYIRVNNAYESPIMAMSHIPLIGKVIENERIYTNILYTRDLQPYIENGYGFTTRIVSMGMFVATQNWKYHGFGFRFGFELFSKW